MASTELSTLKENEVAGSTEVVSNRFIRLAVITSDRTNEVHFNIKPNTPFLKLKRAYCSKLGHEVDELRFIYDGLRIIDGDTPESLGMINEDVIEVYQEKIGGM